jgi:hypothetical protein
MKQKLSIILLIVGITSSFLFGCKKGTNSTKNVTNGIAYFKVTYGTAIATGQVAYIQFITAGGTTKYATVGATSLTSDNISVTQGQNVSVALYYSGTACNSVKVEAYYNNSVFSTLSFSMGLNNCADMSYKQTNFIIP